MSHVTISLNLTSEQLGLIDAARGRVDRTTFILRALDREIEPLLGVGLRGRKTPWARQNAVEQGSPFPVTELTQAYPHGGKKPSDQGIERPRAAAKAEQEGSDLPPTSSGAQGAEAASSQGVASARWGAGGEAELAGNALPNLEDYPLYAGVRGSHAAERGDDSC